MCHPETEIAKHVVSTAQYSFHELFLLDTFEKKKEYNKKNNLVLGFCSQLLFTRRVFWKLDNFNMNAGLSLLKVLS